MKFELRDVVKVISGKYADHQGSVMGQSVVTRSGQASMSEYKVQFKDLKITEEFREDQLVFVSKEVIEVKEADQRRAAFLEKKRLLDEKKKALEAEIAEMQEEQSIKSIEDGIKRLEEQKQKMLAEKDSKDVI